MSSLQILSGRGQSRSVCPRRQPERSLLGGGVVCPRTLLNSVKVMGEENVCRDEEAERRVSDEGEGKSKKNGKYSIGGRE